MASENAGIKSMIYCGRFLFPETGPSGKLADSSRETLRDVARAPAKKGWLALSLSKIVYPRLSGCPETGRENSTCLQNSTCLFYLSTKFYLSILLVTRYSTCLFYLSTKFYLSRGILLVYKKFYLSILLV